MEQQPVRHVRMDITSVETVVCLVVLGVLLVLAQILPALPALLIKHLLEVLVPVQVPAALLARDSRLIVLNVSIPYMAISLHAQFVSQDSI